MEWVQFVLMLVAFVGLFYWNRTEGRADNRQMLALMQAINQDMKDFHARLAVQDAEYKQHMMCLHDKWKKG